MIRQQGKDYKIIEENQLFVGKQGNLAKTSPLLECAGLFIYSSVDEMGILAHWQSRSIEKSLHNAMSELELRNPNVVISGCGVPIESPIEDSQTYDEVRKFLNDRKILIRDEKIGLDRQVELQVNFSNGVYRVNYL